MSTFVLLAAVAGGSGAVVALVVTTARLRQAHHRLAQMAHQAGRDTLTGLANRQVLTRALATAVHHRPAISVAIVDLDRFTHLNHHHGYRAGDTVLAAVADRLEGLGAPVGLVARLCGDEFAVLIEADLHEAYTTAWQAWHAIAAAPVPVDAKVLPVRASIGVAGWRPGLPTGQVLHHADLAMHRAKAAGTGVYAHTRDLPDQPVTPRPPWRARDLPRPRPLPHHPPPHHR